MSKSNDGSGCGCGCFGCLGVIAFGFIIWALCFGITIDGVHHTIGCSTGSGVEVSHESRDGGTP